MLLLWLALLWRGSLTQKWALQLELPESVTVEEGLCAHVPCKFYNSWVPHLYTQVFLSQGGADMHPHTPVATNRLGQRPQAGTQGRFILPWRNNCSLSIRDAKMADSGNYLFLLETPQRQQIGKKTVSLKVTALTQSPDIQIPSILESGHPRNLTCAVPWACKEGTPPIFSWNSAALTSLGPRTYHSSVLTLSPRPQDHRTSLTCQVTFPAVGVSVERTIQLNVSYAPQNMAISVFQGNNTALKLLGNASSLTVPEGQSLHLHCTADSNPPARLAWFRGAPTLNASPISHTGYTELPQTDIGEDGVFACQAQNHLGSQHVLLTLSVQWRPDASLRVLEGVGGAGFMALFCLCVYLVFRVKTRRKRATKTMESADDTNTVLHPGPRERQHQFQRSVSSDYAVPSEAGPVSAENEELHYALLSFEKLKSQEQKSCNTEYSEIKMQRRNCSKPQP